jgi:peptidoglycan hydrolase FlgJ
LAIILPTDIVLGVANAADPQKLRVAVERLQRERLQNVSAAGKGDFQTLVAQSAAPTPDVAPSNATTVPARMPWAGAQHQDKGKLGTFGKLEAFVLQTFVQAMLPKDGQNFFGKGTAGAVWKSMLAEKLANELAKSGQIGLAKRLAGHMGAGQHAAPGPQAASLVNHGLDAGLAASAATALGTLQPTLKSTPKAPFKPTRAQLAGGSPSLGASPIPDDRS